MDNLQLLIHKLRYFALNVEINHNGNLSEAPGSQWLVQLWKNAIHRVNVSSDISDYPQKTNTNMLRRKLRTNQNGCSNIGPTFSETVGPTFSTTTLLLNAASKRIFCFAFTNDIIRNNPQNRTLKLNFELLTKTKVNASQICVFSSKTICRENMSRTNASLSTDSLPNNSFI